MTEIKDNSISLKGSILNMQEKTVNKGRVMDLHIRIPSDELDGKRDSLAMALEGRAEISITPNQTELDLKEKKSKVADGQTEMIDKDGKVKNPVAKKPAKPKVSGETKAAKAAAKPAAKKTAPAKSNLNDIGKAKPDEMGYKKAEAVK